jgi:hypothetical protein
LHFVVILRREAPPVSLPWRAVQGSSGANGEESRSPVVVVFGLWKTRSYASLRMTDYVHRMRRRRPREVPNVYTVLPNRNLVSGFGRTVPVGFEIPRRPSGSLGMTTLPAYYSESSCYVIPSERSEQRDPPDATLSIRVRNVIPLGSS